MRFFYKEYHTHCYGPEVMDYPTYCGINDWGEVVYEDPELSEAFTEYDIVFHEDKGASHPNAHVELPMLNPWAELAMLRAKDKTEDMPE